MVTQKIGRRRWRLVEPFEGVPAGFEFDGASVPRVFWAILDPASEGFEAACLHDWRLSQGFGWLRAAKLFRDDLIRFGLPSWRARLIYNFVAAYGLIR